MIHIPDVPHGGVAITDVQCLWGSQHAFGWTGFAGNDEIISPQIELLQGEGHKRQIVFVPAF